MYTSNIKKGDIYSKLEKVVAINILDFIILPLDQIYSKFHIKEEKSGYKLTDVLEIYYLELGKLRHNKYKGFIDKEDPIIKCII
jgi:predicted transposase/invertase (TIGR01784 family)